MPRKPQEYFYELSNALLVAQVPLQRDRLDQLTAKYLRIIGLLFPRASLRTLRCSHSLTSSKEK